MQDNTKRGERALFWMKAIFVIFILYFFWSSPINAIFPGTNDNTVTASVLVRIAFGALVSLGMLFSLIAFLVSFLSWLHRAIANLRVISVTDFSPMGAVLLTCIPLVGFVLHFWIFNDMVARQQDCMHERGILKDRFPKKFLIGWVLAEKVFDWMGLGLGRVFGLDVYRFQQSYRSRDSWFDGKYFNCRERWPVHQMLHVLHCSRT